MLDKSIEASPSRSASADPDAVSVELASRRTGMSFQRTRMSADRTLMSVIPTSLSLITFGFTIFQVFQMLKKPGTFAHDNAPRNFALTLVFGRVGRLTLRTTYHL